MARRVRRPQKGGTPETVIPHLALWFGLCLLMSVILWIEVPWLAAITSRITLFCLVLTLGCLGYVLWIHRTGLFPNSDNGLGVVNSRAMVDFLAATNMTVDDPIVADKILIPHVSIVDNGLKIEAIGDLRDKLVSEHFKTSLEAFLNRHNCDVVVQNAQYHSDVWVYYTLVKSAKSDRVRF
jgi:hypothetical protein